MNETAPSLEPELLRVTRLHTLPDDLMALHEEATAQGYQFLDKLAAEWHNGTNRYDQDGQGFYGVWDGAVLIGVGGFTADPYNHQPGVARVRRVYIADRRRGQGAGRLLLQAIIAQARHSYQRLTLRAVSPDAARFYERLGFRATDTIPNVTHFLDLRP